MSFVVTASSSDRWMKLYRLPGPVMDRRREDFRKSEAGCDPLRRIMRLSNMSGQLATYSRHANIQTAYVMLVYNTVLPRIYTIPTGRL